jgi:spore coat protein CotH
MKNLIGFLLLFTLLSCSNEIRPTVPVKVTTGADYVFDLKALPKVTIEVSTEEWNKLLQYYDMNSRNETMVKAEFTFEKNGVIEKMTGVGLRIRGNLSRKRPEGSKGQLHNAASQNWNHAHFKLDFNEFISVKTNFHDLGGLNLKWFKDDGDYAREVYCYNLFQKFGVWTAPLVSYCRLYIKIKEDPNAAYFGVYEMIEPLDKYYLKARFGDPSMGDDGYLWKCLWGATLAKGGGSSMGTEYVNLSNKSLSVQPAYDLKTKKADIENAKARLVDFIDKLNTKQGDNFKNWIVDAMDVDQLLRLYAVNILVGMWDDYWKDNGNNYYFYFDEKGRAYFIPYDYDNTLGVSMPNFGNMGTEHVVNWGPSPKPVLLNKILAVPEFKAKYIQYVSELISPTNDLFDFTCSTNRIIEWQTMISPYISNDTGEDMAIVDQPTGSWSSYNYYKLLAGDASGEFPFANYFKTRIVFAQIQLGLPTNQNVWISDTAVKKTDLNPPKFVGTGDAKLENFGPYFTVIPVKADEGCVVYYIALPANAPAPSSAQIIAGSDAADNPVPSKGAFILAPNTLAMQGIALAKPDTAYKAYMTAMDWAKNVQPAPKVVSFTTMKQKYISPQDNGDTLTFRFQSSNTNIVYMRGEFNQFKLSTPLTKVSADMWEVTLKKSELKKNTVYLYSVHPHGKSDWYPDNMNPALQANGGRIMSLIWWEETK